jgi:hypothetical protein
LFDDLAAHFHEGPLTAYSDYVKLRDGDTSGRSQHLRAALETATQLYHFREHLPAGHKYSRSQVEGDCPDYRLIADVTNVSKHAQLGHSTPAGPPLVRVAEDIKELTIATLYEDSEGQYSDPLTRLVVNCTDGTTRSLDSALTNVMNYWGRKLHDIGVLKEYRPFPPPDEPGSHFVARKDAKNMNLEMMQGVRFSKRLQLRKFNTTTGRSEPLDLTGKQFQFRVYKPAPLSIFVEIRPAGTAKPFIHEIPLSEAETTEYLGLRSNAQRDTFMRERVQKLFQPVLGEAVEYQEAPLSSASSQPKDR